MRQAPVHLPFLTPQIAGQMVQVWSVHLFGGLCETPDFEPPLHETPPKKARHTQDKMRLHFANITSLSQSTIDWIWGGNAATGVEETTDDYMSVNFF